MYRLYCLLWCTTLKYRVHIHSGFWYASVVENPPAVSVCMFVIWIQIKYKRMNLETTKIYKQELKEFYEKYPDAKQLLARYIRLHVHVH